MNPDKSIPLAILKGAKGLASLTVAKAGVLLAYKLGTGLVISRRSDGSWSAPSAMIHLKEKKKKNLGYTQVWHEFLLTICDILIVYQDFLNLCYS